MDNFKMEHDKKKHLCSWLEQISGYPFFTVEINADSGIWSLNYKSFSSEQDVLSGEAENIGEPLGDFSIVVQFCPFCGLQLAR